MDTKTQGMKTVVPAVPPSPAVPTAAPVLTREEPKVIEGNDSSLNVTKKAQFRKYLLKSGFKYAIIRAIVALYEDSNKPDDPLSWIFGFIGHGIPIPQVVESCQEEAKTLRAKIDILQQENSKLKAQLEKKEAVLEVNPHLNEFDWKSFMESLSEEEEFTDVLITK